MKDRLKSCFPYIMEGDGGERAERDSDDDMTAGTHTVDVIRTKLVGASIGSPIYHKWEQLANYKLMLRV